MNILEQEIEQLVWDALENYDHDLLAERGLPVESDFTYKRQLDLGSYGRADIVGFNVSTSRTNPNTKKKDRFVNVQILELKKEKINAATFFQALRYAKGIQHKMRHENINYIFYFTFHLIGKSLDKESELLYITDFFQEVNFYTYELNLRKGLVFNRQFRFQLVQPSFKKDSTDIKEILFENVESRINDQREALYFERVKAGIEPSPFVSNTSDVSEDLPF